MGVTSCWGRALVVLKTVASIEELANVATHILLQNELTARMVIHVISDVDYHLIKDNEFLSKPYRVLEVVLGVVPLFLYFPFNLAR